MHTLTAAPCCEIQFSQALATGRSRRKFDDKLTSGDLESQYNDRADEC